MLLVQLIPRSSSKSEGVDPRFLSSFFTPCSQDHDHPPFLSFKPVSLCLFLFVHPKCTENANKVANLMPKANEPTILEWKSHRDIFSFKHNRLMSSILTFICPVKEGFSSYCVCLVRCPRATNKKSVLWSCLATTFDTRKRQFHTSILFCPLSFLWHTFSQVAFGTAFQTREFTGKYENLWTWV